MMRRRPNDGAEEIDEHNQPTEPFDIRSAPFARTVTDDQASSMTQPAQPPAIGAYPYLPPPPTWQNKRADDRPIGDMNVPENVDIASSSRKRWAVFPALVGLCFVVVQVLLLVNFALKMIGQWNGTAWMDVMSMLSDLFVWPLQVLVQQIPLPFTISPGIVTLVAILLYGVLSRIVVRCLKLLLRTR